MREGSIRVPVRAASTATGGHGLSSVTGVVLAGGRSTRFGADKLAADLRGMPLLHHAVIRVAEVCGDVVVVAAPGVDPPSLPPGIVIRVARDAHGEEGPLAGLAAGLAAVTTDLALVAAGDMPDLSVPVLSEMLRVAAEAQVDAVALADGDRVRPLPCVLVAREARAHADAILRSDERSRRSVRSLLDSLRVAVIDEHTWRRLDPAGTTLHDIDEPGDLSGAAR